MKTIGIAELKATLSEQLSSVKAGEEILVTDRGKPIARIVPIADAELPEKLEALARKGVIKLPSAPPGPLSPPRVKDPKGRLMQALLEDRREAR